MQNKTTGIIATLAATVLCGCPGIFACLFGALSTAGLGTWITEITGTDRSGGIPTSIGVGILCLGLILIAIPIVVGILTLRKRPSQDTQPSIDVVPPPS